jgi:hypothetical protein
MVSSVITRVRSCSSEVPNPNPGNHVDRFARQRNGVWRLQFFQLKATPVMDITRSQSKTTQTIILTHFILISLVFSSQAKGVSL